MTEELENSLIEWHTDLKSNKAELARLRRCECPSDAVQHASVHRLKRILHWIPLEAAAAAAGLLSHIEENTDIPLGTALARPKEKTGRIPFSELRFRQLLSSSSWDEVYRSLRRALAILEGKVNIASVVEAVTMWNNEFRGDAIPGKSLKFKLSESYYQQVFKNK